MIKKSQQDKIKNLLKTRSSKISQVTAYIPLQFVRSEVIPLVKIKVKGATSYIQSKKISLDQLISRRYKFTLESSQTTLASINSIVVRDGKTVVKTIELKQPVDIEEIKKELAQLSPPSKTKWGVVALILLSATAVAYVKRDLLQSGLAKLTS